MRFTSGLALFASLSSVLSATDTPPDSITQICKKRGQVPQKVGKSWGCASSSSICDPEQDQSTLHEDRKTGEWACCPRGQPLVGSSCEQPKPDGKPDQTPIKRPGTCGALVNDAGLENLLRVLLQQCYPHDQVSLNVLIKYFITILHQSIDLIDIFYKKDCDTPTPGPGPNPKPSPGPHHDWYDCSSGSTCKWLPLENNKTPKNLAVANEPTLLPNPNAAVASYKYPFDTWVTKFEGDDLDIYIQGRKLPVQESGTSYLIPAGTSASEVYYKSSKGAKIQFYGACSADTPCVSEEVKDWVQGPAVLIAQPDADIDVSGYDFDLVFTIADTSVTTEQYTVLADGKEVGKTHGRLSLGCDKYNTKYIANVDVGVGPYGALRSIANDGFWGSFKIPKETKKVTVHMNYESPSYPYFLFEYRMDKLCQC
ncbi:hypothetical protein HRG_000634 [Hirsutella rhossiliensis]|uniref:Uncharacterized protein n=1 Tax=Hirsutella rhossiliensis TaxID=111463 RepID=A0A9P8NB96_9HYPO|nr:uncharacterized protein HRG_00634 [Hirsutella rhossiliensis]KAH0967992.1 hypothetical protein HRG_00634 [Hirsutella rhossiliensis]